MKVVKKNIYRSGLSVLMAVLMTHQLTGCNNLPVQSTGQSLQANAYDGQTIMRGLFFGSGPVADLFPEIWQRSDVLAARQTANLDEVAAIQNRIVEAIRAESPDFYERFGREMTSGDHLRIQRALDSAAESVWKVVHGDVDRGKTILPTAGGWAGDAVVVDIFVAVEAFFVVFIVGFWGAPPEKTPGIFAGMTDTPLGRDMVTDWIATRLAT